MSQFQVPLVSRTYAFSVAAVSQTVRYIYMKPVSFNIIRVESVCDKSLDVQFLLRILEARPADLEGSRLHRPAITPMWHVDACSATGDATCSELYNGAAKIITLSTCSM